MIIDARTTSGRLNGAVDPGHIELRLRSGFHPFDQSVWRTAAGHGGLVPSVVAAGFPLLRHLAAEIPIGHDAVQGP
jgi:hypothetical protein